MRIVEEIESEFEATRTASPDSLAEVHHSAGTTLLARVSLGADFISGLGPSGIVAYPSATVKQIVAKVIPEQSPITLAEFLQEQRLPVRVDVISGAQAHRGWLLNVQGSWLRLATELQVIWCPLEAVAKVEIRAVENL